VYFFRRRMSNKSPRPSPAPAPDATKGLCWVRVCGRKQGNPSPLEATEAEKRGGEVSEPSPVEQHPDADDRIDARTEKACEHKDPSLKKQCPFRRLSLSDKFGGVCANARRPVGPIEPACASSESCRGSSECPQELPKRPQVPPRIRLASRLPFPTEPNESAWSRRW
jgi:hypothetical protein